MNAAEQGRCQSMKSSIRALLLTIVLLFPVVAMALSPREKSPHSPVPSVDRPEAALRQFLIAWEERGVKALRKLIVPVSDADFRYIDSDSDSTPAETTVERSKQIKIISGMKIRALKVGDPFMTWEGEKRTVTKHEVGAEHALLLVESAESPVSLCRINGHWLIDMTPLISRYKARMADRKSSEGTPLSATDRQHLLNDSFRVVDHVAALPDGVREYFWRDSRERSNRLVDPGGPFSAGCTIGKDASHRRLLFAGVGDEYRFVYFEQGGVGDSSLLYLFRQQNGDTEMVWGGDVQGYPKNLEELRACMRKNHR